MLLDTFYKDLYRKPSDESAHLIVADYLECECDNKPMADVHRWFVENDTYPRFDINRLIFFRAPKKDRKYVITDTLLFSILVGELACPRDSVIYANFRSLVYSFVSAFKHYKRALTEKECFQVSKNMWLKGNKAMIRTVAPYGMDKVEYCILLPSYHEIVFYRTAQLAPKHEVSQRVSEFAHS